MPLTRPLKQSSAENRRAQIAAFFREHRAHTGLSAQAVVADLGLQSVELLLAYESGAEAIPLDEIFSLTNLLNIPPEDVMALVYNVHCDIESEIPKNASNHTFARSDARNDARTGVRSDARTGVRSDARTGARRDDLGDGRYEDEH